MVKLLIADRDENERVGIKWLVSSYAIPYEKILLAGTLEQTIQLLEKEMPEVVCIEMDMVQSENWDQLKHVLYKYAHFVIVITAEATFDRAFQAIELHAYSLWLKPILPDEIKRVLQFCFKNVKKRITEPTADRKPSNQLSYRSLFVEGEINGETKRYGILLLQTENVRELQILTNFIEEYPFQPQPTIFPLSDMVACVFERDPEQDPNLKQLGKLLIKQWEKTNRGSVAGVFYLPNDKQTLHQSYIHAKHALKIHFFKGYRQITVMEEAISWREIDPFLTPEEQRKWIEMLNNGTLEEIKKWMYDDFFKFSYPYPDPGLLRTRLSSILAQVRRFMKSSLLDQGKIENEYHRVFDSILYTSVLYRIVQDVLLFLKDVIECAVQYRFGRAFDVTEKAIQYIEQNFADKKLSLYKVAQFVGRSPAYFSTILSEKKGETFRQVLTNIRIKEAQRLLVETTLSIQEIADQTGFSNPNYFSRIFKEVLGVPPRVYRDRK